MKTEADKMVWKSELNSYLSEVVIEECSDQFIRYFKKEIDGGGCKDPFSGGYLR